MKVVKPPLPVEPKRTFSPPSFPPHLPHRVICIPNDVVIDGSTSYIYTHTHTHNCSSLCYVRAHLLLRRMHTSTLLLPKSCSGPIGLKSCESLLPPLRSLAFFFGCLFKFDFRLIDAGYLINGAICAAQSSLGQFAFIIRSLHS